MKKVQYSFSGEQPAPVQRIGSAFQINFNVEEPESTNDVDNEPIVSYKSLYARVESLNYAVVVSAIIGTRYDASDVEAILLNYMQAQSAESTIDAEKKSEYIGEYEEFQFWRMYAKEIAQKVVIISDMYR